MSNLSRMIFAVIITFLVHVEKSLACPACKDSFTSAGGNASIGDAYSWSILFMLGVPLTIVTAASIFIVRRVRQHSNSLSS